MRKIWQRLRLIKKPVTFEQPKVVTSNCQVMDSEPDPESGNLHNYPDPFVVEPTGEHKTSFIVLHGRGDQARSFAKGFYGFLQIELPDGRTIHQHLPNTRFIFPSAKRLEARQFKEGLFPQWFDCKGWRSRESADWEYDGLRETTQWVHELMGREIRAVGSENVVLGGLSQGCASSLIAVLLWEGEPIRGVFGMSGWLPLRHIFEPQASTAESIEAGDGVSANNSLNAIKTLAQTIGISVVGTSTAKNIPITLLHGGADHTVEIEHGHGARDLLSKLGLNVTWKEYPDLTHWMCGDELSDIIDFLGIERAEVKS